MKNLQDFTASDYLQIIRRRKWYWIIPAVLISIGTAVYVWRMPSVYKSETTIMVSERLLPEDYIGSLVRQSVMDHIEFAKQQLRSRTFVERIAQEFQMGGNGLSPELVQNFVIASTEVTVLPPNIFKLAFYSSDPSTAQAVTRRLAERVMQSNNASRQEKVSVADEFLDEQVRQAADDLSQAEQKLVDFHQKNFPGVPQQGATIEGLSALQAELLTTEDDLKAALNQRAAYERTLSEHKDLKLAASPPQQDVLVKTSAAPPASVPLPAQPERSPLEQQLAQRQQDLASLLTRYKTEHPDVLRLKREIRDLQTAIASMPKTSAGVAAAPEVKEDSKSLPELDIAVDFYEAEMKTELERLKRPIEQLEAKKKDLSSKVALYGRRMNMPADMMQQLSALTQDRDLARQRYSYLSTKKLNSDLAGKVDTDANNKTFTTVDPPNLPQLPVRPDRRTLTGTGCVVGLLIGIGLAFAREVLDPALSDQDSAAAALKLPVLTSIPSVGTGKRQEVKVAKKRKREALALRLIPASPLAVSDNEEPIRHFSIGASGSLIGDVVFGRSSIAAEQYQMLRTGLNAQRQKGLKTLLVTSAIPDEGKTFVACCLAGFLSREQDKKVLLIDGDLRTGSAGHALGIDKHRPRKGLSDVLRNEANIEDCLISSELNLWFLPAGSPTDNPVELLSSPRLGQIMRDLTLLFDWVIVDSPPVLPIADTSVLNPICDAALVVLRADRTPASLTNEAINKIGRERVLGVVLNGVRDIKTTHYYGRYYNQAAQVQR